MEIGQIGDTSMEHSIASSELGTTSRETSSFASRPIVAALLSYPAIVWRQIRAGFWKVGDGLGSDFNKPLNIDRITAHLAVVKRAEEEGHCNLPPSDEEALSGTQREIVAYFTNLRRRARQRVVAAAEKTGELIEQIHVSDSIAEIRNIPATCESKIRRCFADCESHLNNTVEREQKQRQHYEAFRKKNSLDRVASYPDAAYLYYLMVPVLIATIILALIRMVEFQIAGGSGEQMVWIVTVSAIVVIVPFAFGDSALREVNHVSQSRRFFGWAGIAIAISTILGIAFYADFHITYVLANPGTTSREVMLIMLAAPLDIVSDVANWQIFGLLSLTGLFAMLLGYRSDDPYPGYGAVQRSFHAARDARGDVFSQLRKRTNTLIDVAGDRVSTVTRGLKNKVRTCTNMVEKSKHNPSALNDYDIELEDACNTLLDRYRVANSAVRQTEPPVSFTEHVCFNPVGDAAMMQFTDSGGRVAELQIAMADLEKEADLAQKELRTLNVRTLDSISEPHPSTGDIE